MSCHPVFEPIEPAIQGRFLGLLSQGIPEDIAAADMLGTLQEACYELPNDARPSLADIIETVRSAILAAKQRKAAAAMS